jgi:hypothetical protein
MQHTALRQAGCKTIFTDELSVADQAPCPAPVFEETRTRRHAPQFSERVWKLDRLSRSLRDRKLIEAGERVEDVAALWNVGRTMLYRALAGCNRSFMSRYRSIVRQGKSQKSEAR